MLYMESLGRYSLDTVIEQEEERYLYIPEANKCCLSHGYVVVKSAGGRCTIDHVPADEAADLDDDLGSV